MKNSILRGVKVALTSALFMGVFASAAMANNQQWPTQQQFQQMPPQVQQQVMQQYQATQNRGNSNNNSFFPGNMNMNTQDMMPSNGWNSGDMMNNMPWGGNNNSGWGDTPPWGDWSNGNYPWGNSNFGKTPPWGDRKAFPNGYPTGWGNGMPLTNPMDNGGQWAHPQFRPWSSGPFGGNQWNQNHPMNNMPWGKFPNWGNGAFGGYGPDTWKGITPWGNDVPFRWIDPNDPKGMVEVMWDDAINTPRDMGRMPPGWTAPSISVPNPIEVGEEFERNARKFPSEMNKMTN